MNDKIVQAKAADGGQLRFDGSYYDWRDSDARRGMKLWVPPGDKPLQALLFFGNPGDRGDTRAVTMDDTLQEFAIRNRIGIVGVTWFPSPDIDLDKAQTFLRVLEEWARLGEHPELKNVPLIPSGGSNGAATALLLLRYAPERVICYTADSAVEFLCPAMPEASLKVPGWIHVGPFDPFFPVGLKDAAQFFYTERPRGALWAWEAEQGKKHCDGHHVNVDFFFIQECLSLRLPVHQNLRQKPTQLLTLPERSGWLADTETWWCRQDPSTWQRRPLVGMTWITPYDDFKGDRRNSVWLPNKDCAFLYRALSTYDNPLKISIRSSRAAKISKASGIQHISEFGRAIDPGERLHIECEMIVDKPIARVGTDRSKRLEWEKLEFYNGAEKFGEVKYGSKPSCELIVNGRRTVYSLTVIGTFTDGDQATCYPLHFIVRDPEISKSRATQSTFPLVAPKPRSKFGSSASSSKKLTSVSPIARRSSLVAYGLSSEQEKKFRKQKNRPSAFWSLFCHPSSTEFISLAHQVSAQKENLTGSKAHKIIAVRAAHTRAGLYFYFERLDKRTGEMKMDVHVARDSSGALVAGTARHHKFLSCDNCLTESEIQYAVAFPGKHPVKAMTFNIPSPWHIQIRQYPLSEIRCKTGIIVCHSKTSQEHPVMEWFIPWNSVGKPGPFVEPPVGTSLAMTLGCNLTTDSSTLKLHWPSNLDPWIHPSKNGPKPNPWGDLVIGPLI